MWEEDSRWQQANFLLLMWVVVFGVVGGFFEALWLGDWQLYQDLLERMGVVFGALCIYAALIWTTGHLVLMIVRAIRRKRPPNHSTSTR
jgi:hypothetical protein